MLVRIAAAISRIGAFLAGLILVAMTLYTLIEIASRELLGVSSNVLVEFIGYGMAAMTFLGAAQTMREGGLIRVNVLLQFASPRVRRVLDALCLLCGIAVIGLAGAFVWMDMQRSFTRGYETDSLIALPLWLPPLGLFIGMVVFVLDMVVHLVLVASGAQRLADESPDAI
jgi:TRAP-type C4-dicarboxylate transport system permease small subunit